MPAPPAHKLGTQELQGMDGGTTYQAACQNPRCVCTAQMNAGSTVWPVPIKQAHDLMGLPSVNVREAHEQILETHNMSITQVTIRNSHSVCRQRHMGPASEKETPQKRCVCNDNTGMAHPGRSKEEHGPCNELPNRPRCVCAQQTEDDCQKGGSRPGLGPRTRMGCALPRPPAPKRMACGEGSSLLRMIKYVIIMCMMNTH